jgi:hypothetical protein
MADEKKPPAGKPPGPNDPVHDPGPPHEPPGHGGTPPGQTPPHDPPGQQKPRPEPYEKPKK